ncbi:hypothetical protein G6F42_020209 [Rhizopus arrhizus]|nr:hypothetical protein G6F42_020209 [Rhizopus arrhizus]
MIMIEVEAPSQSKGRPDLVKLAALMEDSCDQVLSNQCVRYRYFSPGLLQDATKTSLFVMNLPSDYFYVFCLVDEFHIPIIAVDMLGLTDVAPGFTLCRSLLLMDTISSSVELSLPFRIGLD